MTLDIAARTTCKTTWPDGACNEKSGSVVILSSEDDAADTIRPRLDAANADLTRIHILEAVRRQKQDGNTSLEQFNLQDDITALQDAIAKLEDVRVVIIDPISAYLGKTDSHVTSKVRGLLAPLTAIAQILRFSVIFVEHLNKSNLKPMYRSSGSIGFIAAARAAWCFGQDPENPSQRVMLPLKHNLAPEQQGLSYRIQEARPEIPAVAWGGPVALSADVVLQPEDSEERSECLQAMDWLREHLSAGPLPAPQVYREAKSVCISERTLKRAKGKLGVKSVKDTFGSGWSWHLLAAEEGQDTPKGATSKGWPSSPPVAPFDGQQGYAPDKEGQGCTCQDCGVHYGTLAGWRAHLRSRCVDTETN